MLSSSTTTSTSLILLLTSAIVSGKGHAAREPSLPVCQSFDLISNETEPVIAENSIISTGVVCNVSGSNFSTSCDVLSGGWPTVGNVLMRMNGTQIDSGAHEVGYGIYSSTGDVRAVDEIQTLAVFNETVTFKNNTSGWVEFTPIYRCITGLIQGCPSGFEIFNGTEVSLCYPEYTDRFVSFQTVPGHYENISVLAGNRSIRETSLIGASNLRQNPSNKPPYGLVSSGAVEGLIRIQITAAVSLMVVWCGFWMW